MIVLAPTSRDADVSSRLLREEGLIGLTVSTMGALLGETQQGAGVVVVTDHLSHSSSDVTRLRDRLATQPHWSELPVIILARVGSVSERVQLLRTLPGATLIERPASTRTFLSAVRAGLRARSRQYELRQQLEQIRVANQELTAAARAKDEFLATLAHELRNPLSALASASHLMDAASDRVTTRQMAQQVISRQVTQMTRLLDDLLDVARITRKRLVLRKELSVLSSIVTSAVETAHPVISAKRHHLNVTVPAEPIYLTVDSVRIAQVLSNLLTNAAKYTEAGGRIDLVARGEGQTVVIEVRDTGIGIPPDALGTIFEMFAQLRTALDRSDGGLGIGLALARGLVELHDGTIEAHSPGVGQGSTFRVSLPVASSAPAKIATPENLPRSARKILLADDNTDTLEAFAAVLREQGHEVCVASSGPAVLDLLQHEQPEVLLLDIGMPGMNGYEVARRVRADFPERRMLLIAISGWGQADDKLRAQQAGFDHHLTKPVDLYALAALMEGGG